MGGKPLLVLFGFVLLIVLFAGGAIGNADLTPGTPYTQTGQQQSNPVLGPVADTGSGRCGSPYTVRKGDTMSQIARTCGVTLSELIAANPNISNPNLIHVNQQIYIPRAQVVSPAQATAVPTSPPAPTAVVVQPTTPPQPTAAPVEDDELSGFEAGAATSTPNASAPVEKPGARPGAEVEVTINGLLPNTTVNYGFGQVGQRPEMLGEAVTDANGSLVVKVKFPLLILGRQKWTVTVVTKDVPEVKVTAVPIDVGW